MEDRSSEDNAARDRVAANLRAALDTSEDNAIEDATRRLMLHLSVDQTYGPPAPSVPKRTGRLPLLLKLLRKRRGP